MHAAVEGEEARGAHAPQSDRGPGHRRGHRLLGEEARDARHDDAPEGRIVAGNVGRCGREEPAEDVLKLDQVENGARHAAQDKHEHDDEQDAALVDLLNLELEKF